MSPRLERTIVAAIIVCATVLCGYWAIRVPIFEAPDEIAHADAAFLYFDTGRAFTLSRATTGDFVLPETRYLMRAVDYRRMRYNDRATVPRGYGSGEFFRAVDANAPQPTGTIPRLGAPIPYVLAFYPSPYYVEVAAAMRSGWALAGHSMSAAFFAARLLDVAMLAGTLVLAYRIFVEMSFRAVQRLMLLAGVGFFPLSTWMGACVQPDDQSALLSAASFLGCAILRKRPRSVQALVLFAASASALGFTKLQYGLAIVVACGIALRHAFDREPAAWRVRVLCVGVVIPAIAALVGHYASPLGNLVAPAGGGDYARHDFLGTVLAAWTHLADGTSATFFGGRPFDGFWFGFGIRGAKAFAGATAENVRFLLIVSSSAAFAMWFVRQLRIARRLQALAKRRGFGRAFAFVGNDPAVNLYAFLTVFLLGIYTFTGGDLALQGRYWFPILIPIVIVSVRAVGNAFPRRLRTIATSSACGFWLTYSMISSPAAVLAMERDFYDVRNQDPTYAIGRIEAVTVDGRPQRLDDIAVPTGSLVTVKGDALDTSVGLPAADVLYRIDASAPRRAQTRLPDERLATEFNDRRLSEAGFGFTFRPASLRLGAHALTITIPQRIGRADLALTKITFVVLPARNGRVSSNPRGGRIP